MKLAPDHTSELDAVLVDPCFIQCLLKRREEKRREEKRRADNTRQDKTRQDKLWTVFFCCETVVGALVCVP